MRNVLEYICESLYLQMLIDLYKQTLDRLNITYMVKKIKQKVFKKLDIFVPQTRGTLDISKTMIFVDKIEDRLKMVRYLQLLLLESIWKKGDQIIFTFSSNQEPFR